MLFFVANFKHLTTSVFRGYDHNNDGKTHTDTSLLNMNTENRIKQLQELLLQLSADNKAVACAFRNAYGSEMDMEDFSNFIGAQSAIATAITFLTAAMAEILISE